MKYVFIITHGRSGSTLLQNLLNTAFGGCIRGENNGALVGLQMLYERAGAARRDFGKAPHPPHHAWYGADLIRPSSLLEACRKIAITEIIRPPEGSPFCGFKEIRFQPWHVKDMGKYLDFIEAAFPGALIIFNVRNVEDAARSGWWKNNPNAVNIIRDMQNRFRAETRASLWVEYENLTSHPMNQSVQIANFLGEPTPSRDAIERVMARRAAVLQPQ